MTSGELRFAERLEQKLENDYLLWYDVPVGDKRLHPDFIVLHPRRGLLVLEVKDWRLDTIQSMDRDRATLIQPQGLVQVDNPLQQACAYARNIASLLQRDPLLVSEHGPYQGRLCFPWAYGVVLSNITRRQFDATDLHEVLPPQRVVCKDEMYEGVDAEAFQQRLWGMFDHAFGEVLTLPQIDRIRWHLFPEVRIDPKQGELFDEEPALPDLLRVMDMQQELLARSLGDGHRVVHGVAGSGKTMILGYRARHLARATRQPILVLCYNKTLATSLQQLLQEHGLTDRVTVASFHAWCAEQLRCYHVPKPRNDGDANAFFAAMVQAVIDAVDRGQIPRAQYGAVLIDEGHDFEPEWFRLVLQMVDPRTNSLLVLYDSAQSIYGGRHRQRFSFRSVGIQASGRTTILRLNYRNTAEVLKFAYEFAKDVLTPQEADEDGVPLVRPESALRHGPPPEVMCLPDYETQLRVIASRLSEFHNEGIRWRDMAILTRRWNERDRVLRQLRSDGVPGVWIAGGKGDLAQDSVKVSTIHSCKGLEFPVVAIPGADRIAQPGQEDYAQEVRLMYVGMTRAMDRLLLTHSGEFPTAE
jgi:hypothetical protein